MTKKIPPVPYTYRRAYDGSLKAIEARYGVSINEIQRATAAKVKDLRGIEEGAFITRVVEGDKRVYIPLKAAYQAWEWVPWTIGPGAEFTKLEDAWLKRAKGDRYPALAPLTAQRLLELPLNGDLRNAILDEYLRSLRDAPKSVGAEIDAFLSGPAAQAWRVGAAANLFIPFPPREKGATVAVGPQSPKARGSTTSTVAVPDDWCRTFMETHLARLERAVEVFLSAVNRCETERYVATRELGVIYALECAARQMKECCADKDQREKLATLEGAAKALLEKSVEALMTNPFPALCPALDKKRNAAAKELYDIVFDAAFAAEVEKLMAQAPIALSTTMSFQIGGSKGGGAARQTTLQDHVAFLIEQCMVPLADTSLAAKVRARVAVAVEAIGAASGGFDAHGADKDNTLRTIASLLGRSANVAGLVVGDLPGPQALGMSLVAIRASYFIPRAIAKGGVAAGEAAALAEKLAISVGLKGAERADFVAGVKSGASGKVIEKQLTSKKWQSAAWSGGMTAFALVALIVTIVDESDAATWSEVWNARIGGALPVVSGALKTLSALLTAGGAWAKGLSAGAELFGYAGCLWGVGTAAWGTVDAILKNDVTAMRKQGFLLMVNSALLLGFALGNPWIMAGATLVILGVALYEGWDTVKRVRWCPQRTVFVGYVEYLGERPGREPKKPACYFRLLRDGAPEVQKYYDLVKTLALDETLLYWPVAEGDARARTLKAAGFTAADITSLRTP